MGDFDWMEQAACRHTNGDWYAQTTNTVWGVTDYTAATAHALAVCHTCPVEQECLTHALTYRERFGVWGGMTADERNLHRRREARRNKRKTA
jgi:WhiB family redox-sensing transcriptional regulator